jgi:hypothetical protein
MLRELLAFQSLKCNFRVYDCFKNSFKCREVGTVPYCQCKIEPIRSIFFVWKFLVDKLVTNFARRGIVQIRILICIFHYLKGSLNGTGTVNRADMNSLWKIFSLEFSNKQIIDRYLSVIFPYDIGGGKKVPGTDRKQHTVIRYVYRTQSNWFYTRWGGSQDKWGISCLVVMR